MTRSPATVVTVTTRLGMRIAQIPLFLACVTVTLVATWMATPPARAGELHPTFPLLDASGLSVLETAEPISPETTCGTCHDTEFIRAHDSHAEVGVDCFLCHVPGADNEARKRALHSKAPAWSATATLLGTGIVAESAEPGKVGYTYNREAFDAEGHVQPDRLTLQDPKSDACGSCHGAVHVDLDRAFAWPELGAPDSESGASTEPAWTSLRTGQIYSAQPMRESGLNLQEKSRLTRSWDAHAERQLDCVDCHYSTNNPIFRRATKARPEHLRFDTRRIELGEYLKRPSHVLAHGADPDQSEGTMRDCATCHDPSVGHDWLPYADRHFATLSCATCHIPSLHAPALRTVDATVVDRSGRPRVELRAVAGEGDEQWGFDLSRTMASSYVTGFEPALLPRREADGNVRLAPHNLVTTYRWVAEESKSGVADGSKPGVARNSKTEIPTARLKHLLYSEDGTPRAEHLSLFDADGDGSWSSAELRLSSAKQLETLQSLLSAAGFVDPQVEASTEPFAITHGVTGGEWALRDCAQCHRESSRIDRSVLLADHSPPGAKPTFAGDSRTTLSGTITSEDQSATSFVPEPVPSLYVLGKHANVLANRIGLFGVIVTVFGIGIHSLFRVVRSRRGRADTEMGGAVGVGVNEGVGVNDGAGVGVGVGVNEGLGAEADMDVDVDVDVDVKPNEARHETTRAAVPPREAVYMYNAYERFWHWLQAAAIFVLLFTGLEIHFPGGFRLIGFDLAVRTHNIIGFVVVINAALAAFYHFASGEIRQFVPEPQGFFRGAILQIRYYVRGIFRGDPHPFEKHPGRKMNVLQQVTYLAILNLLLPLQIGTGLLMWGAQRWSTVDSLFGGLGFLGPVHTLGAWLFAAFLVVHIYLTTTGPTPTTYVKAMVTGWEEEPPSHVAGRA